MRKHWWARRAEPVEGVHEGAGLNVGTPHPDGLLQALQWLDHLLERAVASARVTYGPEATADRFRGLHISPDEVERLLAREPGTPTLQPVGEEGEESLPKLLGNRMLLTWLAQAFDLSPFDVELILIALAPELDLRYERLYAYLQDDVTRRRPSVDLALNLLCPTAAAKLARRVHFASDAPLIRHGLLTLIPDPNQIRPPLLGHYLKLDDQIVRQLLGQGSLDPRLAPFCQYVAPVVTLDKLPLNAEVKLVLPTLVRQAREADDPLRLYLYGPHGMQKRWIAEALAGKVGTSLLAVDLVRALAPDVDFDRVLKVLFREAWFQDAVLYLEPVDALTNNERVIPYRHLLTTLAKHTGITILAGEQPWASPGKDLTDIISVPLPIPAFSQRRTCWQTDLAAAEITLDTDDLDALAGRFRLTPDQIAAAVAIARNHARWRTTAQSPEEAGSHSIDHPSPDDLFEAARAQTGRDLAGLAHKIKPVHTWSDIVLPNDALSQLRELCQQVVQRHRVLSEWGFGRKLSLGKGVNALFVGPSGTGKTMAAEIIANELGLDLYEIDLSGVVSKYIGETEKNLERIFSAAENANAILFFDEADALFGKRSEVHDSHDRYANIEIAYLLQKMDQYDGVAILATNLRQNTDEAFIRRLQFIVEFPFPDEAHRYRIWRIHFPPEAPRDDEIDYTFLAKQFRIAGGNIKNIVLAAAFLAAASGERIGMPHLIQATQREYQKLGKLLSLTELGLYATEVIE